MQHFTYPQQTVDEKYGQEYFWCPKSMNLTALNWLCHARHTLIDSYSPARLCNNSIVLVQNYQLMPSAHLLWPSLLTHHETTTHSSAGDTVSVFLVDLLSVMARLGHNLKCILCHAVHCVELIVLLFCLPTSHCVSWVLSPAGTQSAGDNDL